ncbi:MAG: hypothetical protein AAF321_09740, partial [Pseudomonadota bacterium]
IPAYGTLGAALCFALVQAAALCVFLADRGTRRVMPIALRRVALVSSCAAAMVLVGFGVRGALGEVLSVPVNLALMTGLCGLIVVRWNLFDARTLWDKALAALARRRHLA